MPIERKLPEYIRRNLVAMAEEAARVAKLRGDTQGATKAEQIARQFRRARQ